MMPRTGSCSLMPPGAPISRQVTGVAAPVSVALYRPVFSPVGPSGLPVFSTSTATTQQAGQDHRGTPERHG
jgi:hypothetical protein